MRIANPPLHFLCGASVLYMHGAEGSIYGEVIVACGCLFSPKHFSLSLFPRMNPHNIYGIVYSWSVGNHGGTKLVTEKEMQKGFT